MCAAEDQIDVWMRSQGGRVDAIFGAADRGSGGRPLAGCLAVVRQMVPGKCARLAALGECLLQAGGPLFDRARGLLELDPPRQHLLGLLGVVGQPRLLPRAP